MFAYASWSVVFGEQPSAAKWNILGTNDASFNDGSGIGNMEVGAVTSVKNSYKFRGYLNSAQNSSSGSYVPVLFDTRNWDTSSNLDISTNKGRFTASKAGFYKFTGTAQAILSGSAVFVGALYKNGSIWSYGPTFPTTAAQSNNAAGVTDTIQLAINDYVDFRININATVALITGTNNTYFTGEYISAT